ncbi:cytochrome b5 [Dichomitus squalens LYAD-421 SS1]|uniref:cytochrome b5 n=1 Tax=Dichomitus squalens (strain LYAD-421) TaxID=732165 RepID=UPI00044128D8|nr:cytochrome b5 [Dichomitus squalens LYAD-421 SS1]EJF64878.1 cytochrome b5 [Dichomitus squalens LYAD-421 SS1]
MASYLKSWLYAQNPEATSSDIPSIETSPPAVEEDDDTETVHGEDDVPPAFPAVNSAQRAASGSGTQIESVPRILTDSQLMPPPPAPSLAARRPGVPGTSSIGNSLAVPSAPSSSLLPPPTTTKPPPKVAKRAKVALAPGHGPLDWANLKKSGQDLRGTDTLLRVTPSMLKEHRTREDAWSAFNGKVYNITHYLPYHPGGEKELMRVAGRDGTKLFASTHAWVNLDYMLDECLVGFMVSD